MEVQPTVVAADAADEVADVDAVAVATEMEPIFHSLITAGPMAGAGTMVPPVRLLPKVTKPRQRKRIVWEEALET